MILGLKSSPSRKSAENISKLPNLPSNLSLTCRKSKRRISVILSVTYSFQCCSVVFPWDIKYYLIFSTPIVVSCLLSLKAGCFLCTLNFVSWINFYYRPLIFPLDSLKTFLPKFSMVKSWRDTRANAGEANTK